MISGHVQGQPFNVTVIHVYTPINNAEEAEVEQFYEDLQDLLELTPKKDVLFKVGSQEIPGVTGKFGLGVQNEAGQRLTELCQENTLVIQFHHFMANIWGNSEKLYFGGLQNHCRWKLKSLQSLN